MNPSFLDNAYSQAMRYFVYQLCVTMSHNKFEERVYTPKELYEMMTHENVKSQPIEKKPIEKKPIGKKVEPIEEDDSSLESEEEVSSEVSEASEEKPRKKSGFPFDSVEDRARFYALLKEARKSFDYDVNISTLTLTKKTSATEKKYTFLKNRVCGQKGQQLDWARMAISKGRAL